MIVMDQKGKVLLTFILLVLFVSAFYLFSEWVSKTTGYIVGEDERTKVALCLGEKNTSLYGDIRQKNTALQLNEFGSAIKFVNYHECNNCFDVLPVWIIDNKKYIGYYNLTSIKSIAGC
jgi:hypothetical protein